MAETSLYTQEQVAAIAQQVAQSAIEKFSATLNLDNISTQSLNGPPKEEQSMPSKVRHKITLSNGQEFTLCGNTLAEAIENFLPKVNQQASPNTPVFLDYKTSGLSCTIIPHLVIDGNAKQKLFLIDTSCHFSARCAWVIFL